MDYDGAPRRGHRGATGLVPRGQVDRAVCLLGAPGARGAGATKGNALRDRHHWDKVSALQLKSIGGDLPAAEFLRQAAIFLAQSGVLAADREDLKQRMREVRRTLG
jgi:hypothetical protein